MPDNQFIGWYIYPPIFAILMLPLAFVSFFKAKLIWLVINQVLLALGTIFLLKCTKNLGRTAKIAIVALTLMMTPIIFNQQMGNVNVALFFLIVLTLFLIIKDRQWLAGVPLGLAVSIKIIPAVLVIYLLFKKRYKAAASALAVSGLLMAIGISVCGWNTTVAFFKEVLPKIGWLSRETDIPTKYSTINQSLHGLIIRLFSDSPDGLTKSLINSWTTVLVLTAVVTLVLAVASYSVVAKKGFKNEKQERQHFVLGFGLFVILSHIVSPISWDEHLVPVIISVVLLIDWLATAEKYRGWPLALGAAGFALVAANHPFDDPHLMQGWKLLLLAPGLFGMLALWVSMMIATRESAEVLL